MNFSGFKRIVSWILWYAVVIQIDFMRLYGISGDFNHLPR